MRIAVLLALAGLVACSREPAKTIDVSTIAAARAESNIDNYAAANAQLPRSAKRGPSPARQHGQ
jgi:hypothetical protein